MPIAWDRMGLNESTHPVVSTPYQEWPRHVHGPDGAFREVADQDACDAALAEGWTLTPGGAPAPVPVKAKRAK